MSEHTCFTLDADPAHPQFVAAYLRVAGGECAFIETNTGTVTVSNGAMQFNGGGTFAGTVDGTSTLVFDGGSDTLTATGSITTGAFYLDAGTLVMQGGVVDTATLDFAAGAEVSRRARTCRG